MKKRVCLYGLLVLMLVGAQVYGFTRSCQECKTIQLLKRGPKPKLEPSVQCRYLHGDRVLSTWHYQYDIQQANNKEIRCKVQLDRNEVNFINDTLNNYKRLTPINENFLRRVLAIKKPKKPSVLYIPPGRLAQLTLLRNVLNDVLKHSAYGIVAGQKVEIKVTGDLMYILANPQKLRLGKGGGTGHSQ